MGTKPMIFIGTGVVIAAALFVVLGMSPQSDPLASGGETACTLEAKICPDGSAVGREGPNCEFAACPSTSSTSTQPAPGTKVTVQAKVNQPVEALGEVIIVRKVIEDSRCPEDVQCVWAGTVKIEAVIRGGMGDGQLTLELGKMGTTEVNAFTLKAVSPNTKSTATIAQSDYVFTFEVVRRD